MKKRFLFYSGTLLVILVAAVLIYNVYKPKQAVILDTTGNNTSTLLQADYTAATITDYLVAQSQAVTILFYTPQTADSLYFQNNIIAPILSAYGDTALDSVIMVDMSAVSETDRDNIKVRFGFYSWPSFSTLQIVNGTTTVIDTLEWDSNNPTTYSQAVDWLIKRGILPETIA